MPEMPTLPTDGPVVQNPGSGVVIALPTDEARFDIGIAGEHYARFSFDLLTGRLLAGRGDDEPEDGIAHAVVPSGTVFTIDPTINTFFVMELVADSTIVVEDPAYPLSHGQRITLIIAEDGVGSHTLGWPVNVLLAGGAAPALGGADVINLVELMWTSAKWIEVGRSLAIAAT